MENYKVYFNPHSNNGMGENKAREIKELLSGNVEFFDLTSFEDLSKAFENVTTDDKIVIAGGDGTLNRLINESNICILENEVYYFPCGSGNDFYKDLDTQEKVVKINKYLKNLPKVIVKGKEYKFLNGIGYGIDGYCCEVGDEMRKIPGKKINYASIAIKGLLFHFKSRCATVTVDGTEHSYKNVWLAPTMNGRYYGGGMMCTPNQNREKNETVSTMVLHNRSRLLTLIIFPTIFKGEHVEHKKTVEVLTGKNIHVKFSSPCALQIDGETVLDVLEYSVVCE